MSYVRNHPALSAISALAMLVGTTWTATAQNATGPTIPGAAAQANQPMAPVTTVNKILRHSRFTSENAPAAIGAGFQPLGPPITVNCPGPGSCLLEVDQHAQVRGSTANNKWAICTRVDGVPMNNPACPFLGTVPSNNTYVGGAFAQTQSISAGDHAVQSYIYTDLGGTRGVYQFTHRVYKNN